MTGTHHRSGTDRCFEAYEKCGIKADIIVNVQGDEPFIAPSQLETIQDCFNDARTQIATLVKPFPQDTLIEAIENPNSPKVVVSNDNYALYFSRSPIPYLRGENRNEWAAKHTYLKHIGLYAYRTDILKQITRMKPGRLELAESLEQLRWLEAGLRIKVGYTDIETIGIDTPEDLTRAEIFLHKNQAI